MRAYERLLNYIQVNTISSETSGEHPSTPSQFTMAHILEEEMQSIGIDNVEVTDRCYVYGTIKATPGMENEPVVGLISHMDTSPSFSGENIKPQLVKNYDGENIVLNKDKNIVLDTTIFPELKGYKGQTLIVTDGTTLLGADDKAGIAEIMTAAHRIISENIPHGNIRIGFTPDEEIGEGADYFDVDRFGAAYAYTVDGGALGELEYENFNAAGAVITVNGNCIHPGEGKNKMKNAILMAMEFNSMLPPFETPAHTEGYEGFYHLMACNGDEEKTVLEYIIRDHDMECFNNRKAVIARITEYMNEKYGEGTIQAEVKDSYYNMKEKILPHMEVVDKAVAAMEHNGVTPKIQPIRGGTDGARLSYMGLPCPNLSTGGHNFHGKYEYIPVESMDAMTDIIVTLVTKN